MDNSNDLLSPISYVINKKINSVFSIYNGENDWRFVVINNYRIEFYNFLNIDKMTLLLILLIFLQTHLIMILNVLIIIMKFIVLVFIILLIINFI